MPLSFVFSQFDKLHNEITLYLTPARDGPYKEPCWAKSSFPLQPLAFTFSLHNSKVTPAIHLFLSFLQKTILKVKNRSKVQATLI